MNLNTYRCGCGRILGYLPSGARESCTSCLQARRQEAIAKAAGRDTDPVYDTARARLSPYLAIVVRRGEAPAFPPRVSGLRAGGCAPRRADLGMGWTYTLPPPDPGLYASGADLDQHAATLARVTREPGESDHSLRTRLLHAVQRRC